MKGKKLKVVMSMALTIVLTSSLLFTGCAKKEEAKTYNWKMAEGHPADYPTTLGDKKFAEILKTKSNGRINIEVYPSAQLGEEKAVLEQVKVGAIQLTRVNSQPLAEFNKQFGALALPYVFDSDEHLWKFLKSDGGTKLLDGLQSSGFKGLAYYSSGSRSFYSRNPLTSINDLKGLKVRVQQNEVTMKMIEALGANATPMAYGEVFSALSTGVIDAAENNFPSFYTSNHYQSAKNMILDEHQRNPEVVLMSASVWNQLSDADKKLVQEAAAESVEYQRAEWAKFEKNSEQKLTEAGVKITKVSDVKPWQNAVKPVIDKYRENYADVLSAIDKAR